MKRTAVSRYTWLIFGIAVLIVVAQAALVVFSVGGETGVVAASDIGELLVVGLSAVAILRSARVLGFKTSVGRPWLLIGLGALSYLVGDAIWTVMEVFMGLEVPYPGLPDVFYLIEYPLFAAGILSAGLAFKGLVEMRKPAIVGAGTALGLSLVVYFGLLQPFVLFEPDVGLGEKVLSTLYPLGDVVLMVAPAAFVLAVVASLSGGRLAWPWWAVAFGAALIAISDTGYSWLSTYDLYKSGSFIDYGWGLGHAFVMLGSLIARDFAITRD